MVIDDEDKEAYETHLDAYHRSFRPIGQPECDAVRLIANAMWRIDRLNSIETGLFELEASFHAQQADTVREAGREKRGKSRCQGLTEPRP